MGNETRGIDRREFLVGAVALTLAAGCRQPRGTEESTAAVAPAGFTPPRVDAHSHIFNARDLPIEGFAGHVGLGGIKLPGRIVERILDRKLQAGTPDYFAEIDYIERRERPGPEGTSAVTPEEPADAAERDLEELLEELANEDPELLSELIRSVRDERPDLSGPAAADSPEFFLDSAVDRLLGWARLMKGFRLDIAERLLATYPAVELFTPALVDMDLWVEDTSPTPIPEQILLGERIARFKHGRIQPMVAFDPLREAFYEHAPELGSLYWVQQAVTRHGCVGVKLYPPMGFQPQGNAGLSFDLGRSVPADLGGRIDRALARLFVWCRDEEVPIMAHCNQSNGARPGYEERAHPRHWAPVLAEHPGLRLDLGHFGGAADLVANGENSRAAQIAALMEMHEHVYADVGYHEAGLDTNDRKRGEYIAAMRALLEQHPGAARGICYGSDWHMIAVRKGNQAYHERFVAIFEDVAPGSSEGFLGGNAFRFLGLEPGGGKNRERIAGFHGDTLPAWWKV